MCNCSTLILQLVPQLAPQLVPRLVPSAVAQRLIGLSACWNYKLGKIYMDQYLPLGFRALDAIMEPKYPSLENSIHGVRQSPLFSVSIEWKDKAAQWDFCLSAPPAGPHACHPPASRQLGKYAELSHTISAYSSFVKTAAPHLRTGDSSSSSKISKT